MYFKLLLLHPIHPHSHILSTCHCSVTQNMICPSGVPANANCIWNWTANTVTSWTNAAVTLNAEYYLLGVSLKEIKIPQIVN